MRCAWLGKSWGSDGAMGGERHSSRSKVLWVGESEMKGAVKALAWLGRWDLETGQLRWGKGGSQRLPSLGGGGGNGLSGV